MANDDLHQPLKAINQTIARLREDVQKLTGEVRKIPEAIKEATQTIRDAIQENIQAQAELKLMDHVMEVRSVKPQIEAEHDQIETERDELDERLESIGERYEDKHAELDDQASQRIRKLGSHIFEIDEQEFEEGIETPFTEQVTTAWSALQAHNAEVREDRTSAVRDTTGDVVQTIHDYVDRQERLVDDIQQHRLETADSSLPTDHEATLQVPYYVVEYEHDGVTERELVVPSRLSSDGDEWCSVSATPIDGTEAIMADVGRVDATPTHTVTKPDLHRAIEPYSDASLLGLSYADAVSDAVPDDGTIPVAVEGGEQ